MLGTLDLQRSLSTPSAAIKTIPFLVPMSSGQDHASKRPMRKRALLAAVVVSCSGLVWVTYDRFLRQQELTRHTAQTLKTITVSHADLVAATDASGMVAAERKVNLSPNVASRIAHLYVQEGDNVSQGQLIAQMENDELIAKTSQVRAQYEAAKANLVTVSTRRSRYEGLMASGAISLEMMEEMRNAEFQAKIQVKEANYHVKESEAAMRNTRVYAPFSGIITRQFAQIGQFVTPTTSVTEKDTGTSTSIAELSSGLEVVAKIAEGSLTEVSPGQKVQIRTDAFPSEVFFGLVKKVPPRAIIENQVNFFPVVITIQTGKSKLKPAMNVDVRFVSEPIRNTILLPLAALITGENNTKGVLRLKHNLGPDVGIEFVPVITRRISGDKIQITRGLKKGDRILISAPPAGHKIPGFQTKPGT